MKKQVVENGVRKWWSEAWLTIQNELFKAIEDGVLKSYGNVVVGGCNVTTNGANYDVSSGVVYIGGKLATFDGVLNTPFPIFLVLQETTHNGEYVDQVQKPVETETKAIAQTVLPGSGSYLSISQQNQNRLIPLKYGSTGAIEGIPVSSLLTLNSESILATAKAAKTLNDSITTVKSKTDKMGSAYFHFSSNTGQNQYQNPTPVGWDVKIGTILGSGGSDLLLQAGKYYLINVVQGDDASNNTLIIDINNVSQTNLQNGRNVIYSGVLAAATFKHNDDIDELEIEVTVLG